MIEDTWRENMKRLVQLQSFLIKLRVISCYDIVPFEALDAYFSRVRNRKR